jgi:hypothetical protein
MFAISPSPSLPPLNPARRAILRGEIQLLTTEPALVTVKPSGDTAEKNDTAGPLSIPSPLHGGSVVKNSRAIPGSQPSWARVRTF